MKVTWLHDIANDDGSVGGAELTMHEFREAAPRSVTFSDDAETVVVGNCTQYGAELIDDLKGRRVIRYWHDLARHEDPNLRRWLIKNATHIFCSPLHLKKHEIEGEWPVIPPAIDLDAFRPDMKRERSGTVSIAAWQNHGKGQQLVADFATHNGGVDVYGIGNLIPTGVGIRYRGALEPEDVAETLWRYRTFVFLPTAVEPFGRCVVEAWAAGCEVLTNQLVGARYFIEKDRESLYTAAERFWNVVYGAG